MHFATAVILEDMRNLTNTLAPFQDGPEQYTQFVSVYKQCKEKYEKENEATKTKYPTLKEYMENYYNYKYDESQKDYGYWENPNARWDYWFLCEKDSMARYECEEMPDGYCKIKDFKKGINWEEYNKAIRIWEIVVEGQPLKDGEQDPFWCGQEFLIKYYGTKERYAILEATPHPYAFVYEGKWYEKDSVDWLESNVSTEDIEWLYLEKFMQIINDPKNQELYIALVDCHI